MDGMDSFERQAFEVMAQVPGWADNAARMNALYEAPTAEDAVKLQTAYRAEHEMTVEAKRLIKAFYGREARYSYWNGCSGGGREGLLQAYRYPDEFDGIIAGDPANVRRNAWALWLATQTFKDPSAYIPPDKYPMIHRFALDACDAGDGNGSDAHSGCSHRQREWHLRRFRRAWKRWNLADGNSGEEKWANHCQQTTERQCDRRNVT